MVHFHLRRHPPSPAKATRSLYEMNVWLNPRLRWLLGRQIQCHQKLSCSHLDSAGRVSPVKNALPRKRFSTTSSSGSRGDESKKETPRLQSSSSAASLEEDPFGLHYRDSKDPSNLGPEEEFPPNYVRDATTGKFTGKIQAEITRLEARLLQMNPLEKEQLLSQRLQEDISSSSRDPSTGISVRMAEVARRIRDEEMALNTFGRDVSDLVSAISKDELHVSRDPRDNSIVSAPLSEKEVDSLKQFMKASGEASPITTKLFKDLDSLLPNVARQSTSKVGSTKKPTEEDPDLDLEWTTFAAQQAMSGIDMQDIESPFASLMPSDLNPAKKVNRKKAKLIPTEILHHNNLLLLRRYITPGGQIMNRVQSRLGAKDQRKVAKMIKRARHLGLIPHIGQWKVEDHGNVKEKDIYEERDWERKLIERGLVERKASIWNIHRLQKTES